MKKIFAFLLLFCMPIVSFGLDDACTNPNEFTVDKRCYVTDKQKQQTPYNAVVKLLNGCTGTLVYMGVRVPYLLTAKHCVTDKDGLARQEVHITLQDGREFDATKGTVGNYDTINDENLSGDYAVYVVNIEKEPLPAVNVTKNEYSYFISKYFNSDYYNARVVGYGVLKIMSDKEISNYKAKYLRYLKDKKGIIAKGDEHRYGFDGKGGVYAYYSSDYSGPYVVNFLDYLRGNDKEYYWDVFYNQELKVSYCRYSSGGIKIGCQGWGGNSGGPIFDDKNAIMGIHNRGGRVIGGTNHAGREYYKSSASIPLFNVNDLIKRREK